MPSLDELTADDVKVILRAGIPYPPLTPEETYLLGRRLITTALAAGYREKCEES